MTRLPSFSTSNGPLSNEFAKIGTKQHTDEVHRSQGLRTR